MAFKDTLFITLDKSDRRRLLVVLLGTILAGLLEMIGIGSIPAFVGIMIDPGWLFATFPQSQRLNWLQEVRETNLLLVGVSMLSGLFVVKTLLIIALVYTETHFLQTIGASISNRLFQGYVQSPYHLHLQRNPAEVVRNLTEEASHAMDFVRAGLRLVREGLVLVFVFLLMVLVEPVVSLAVFFIFGSVSAVFYSTVRRVVTQRGRLWGNHWSRRVQIISQSLGAIKDVKLLGRESHLMNLFRTETASLHRHETFHEVTSLLPRYFLELLSMAAAVLIIVIFLLSDRSLGSLAPVLVLYGMAVARLLPALISINSSLLEIRYRWPSLELVCAELKALQTSPVVKTAECAKDHKTMAMLETMTLENIHYRYPDVMDEALQGVSVTIQAGTMVGLVGASGAGKSTLIELIVGLHVPNEGRVLVDRIDIHQDLQTWQSQIGYVQQNIYLIDDSIRRNIAFGLPDDEIDDLALARAVRAARLESFVGTLPLGLETTVGHQGIRLSGGQRQRIAIARALYRNPSVLVMDEATNALDEETEFEIMTELRLLQKEKTIIVAAHRPSTVEGCDQLIRLEAGRIVPKFKMAAAGQPS
jgi:ATP-binding cassette subfamily C protein